MFTQEEIIEMAEPCGLLVTQQLEAFAKLVADVVTAKAAEREREAMITEAAKQGWAMKNEDPFEDAVRDIATIRARKDEE